MKKICVVCGKEFTTDVKNQVTCSHACRYERKKQISNEYRKAHPEKMREYQRRATSKKLEEIKKPKSDIKNLAVTQRAVKALDDDPKWIKNYCEGDRLTKISMLAIALVDYQIALITYGKLSTLWNTDQYDKWEKQVFRLKRKDASHVKAKNTTESKNKS